MARNIVLCADGTGNKGGYTPDSNVYRMYHAVDIHDADNPQIIYYDNGVGTETNKFLRALGGALGFGFSTNVKDLYKYLARKYEPGEHLSEGDSSPDKVYLFGFSRGAATIRAFSGFIHTCGLVDGRGLSDDKLTERVDEEFRKYKKWKKNPSQITPVKKEGHSHGVIDVEFLGVWDTVSALGFPQRTDITSLGLWVLNWIFVALDHLTDMLPFLAHRFYKYDLTENVQCAYQALALDDARTAFWPWVWDERDRAPGTVEQVFFTGMHSNVGGGYNRSGLASVTMEWMMERASCRGLNLREDKVNEVSAEAHAHGRMYDSRDGFAVFYRYHPRELTKLCANKLLDGIKVHNSVIERMCKRTANYAPTQLPDKFTVTETDMSIPGTVIRPAKDEKWASAKSKAFRWIFFRKWLYGIMLESTLLVVGFALYLWACQSECLKCEGGEGPMGHIADVLNYILPDMFCGLIAVAVLKQPLIFWSAVSLLLVYLIVRWFARDQTEVAGERLRRMVMKAVNS